MDFGKKQLEKAILMHPESYPANVINENFDHFVALLDQVGGRWDPGTDSYLFDGVNYAYKMEFLKKQEALFRAAMVSKHALQIGAYMGHSLFLLLIANPALRITCIDADDHYAGRTVEYLNAHFGNRIHYIHAEPEAAIPLFETKQYDLIHFDNSEDAVKLFELSRRAARHGAFYVFNHYERIQTVVDGLIEKGALKPITTPWCESTNIVVYLVQ